LIIFSIPKGFSDHTRIIQRNAIKSWRQLRPEPRIMLFGEDEGVEKTAEEFGVGHVRNIKKNEYGTPLLSSAFQEAQQRASTDILIYANADIIFFQDLIQAIEKIDLPQFLICGRRWDLDVDEEIDLSRGDWVEKLMQRVRAEGRPHSLSGLDYFIFRRGTVKMPRFAVGRPGWDGWLIGDMRRRGVPVIDATEAITVVHQNHDYSHSRFGGRLRVGGPELTYNFELAGGLSNMLTLREADWLLTKEGLRRPEGLRRVFSLLALFRAWRHILAIKRLIYERVAGSNW